VAFDIDKLLITDDFTSIIKDLSDAEHFISLNYIFQILTHNTNLIPQLGFKDTPIIRVYLERWIKAYSNGYANRPSKRNGQQSSTFPDEVLRHIYQLRFEKTDEEIDIVSEGHVAMMTLENIIGDLLEEYIDCELNNKGWICCWGKIVRHVDFCHSDGTLLQIKNSDNSENSSSRIVRSGTGIIKWFRRKSRKRNEYDWQGLIEITGDKNLSENAFRDYIELVIDQNPKCIYFEDGE
jgi:hypothetical protein